MKTKELIRQTVELFAEAGVPEPEADTYWILRETMGISKQDLLMNPDLEADSDKLELYSACVDKRKARIPLQYIFGFQDFCGFRFKVDESTLIPRYDTEVLVEEILRYINTGDEILDICTGSGCILLSVLGLSFDTSGMGSDISKQALEIARQNIENVPGVAGRAVFVESDILSNIPKHKYQIIVSNPPYVTDEEYDTLEPEVQKCEPKSALVADENGMYFYRNISKDALEFLEPGGRLFFEIGCSQAEQVSEFMSEAGFEDIVVVKDLAGLDRVVHGRLPIKI